MAEQERKEGDLYIKPKSQRRSKHFFVTSSAKMSGNKNTKTTISSSVFTKMSQSFAEGDYLLDDAIREPNASILYMLQEMQQDIDDVYNEVSASAFEASFFPFATIDSGSFGLISSSLVPDKDDKYDLGASGKEWNNLFIDGTANIDSLAMGTTVTSIKDEDNMSSDSATALATQQSIKAYVDANAGGGSGGSGNYDTGSNLIPHADNTYDLGSKTKEWKNLYVDGVAHIDSLAGTTLTAPIRTLYRQVTAMKTTTLDAQSTDVFEFNISKPVTVDLITPLFPGQEITIMNIGAGAITITRSQGGKATSIYHAKGANLTINQHEAYKFVVNQNQLWYVIS